MKIIKWVRGKGQIIRLEREEAKELIHVIGRALAQLKAQSSFISPPTKIEIIEAEGKEK